MKKLLSILIVPVLFLGGISCQRDINYGMVAYYPFDGNANDMSGANNHAVVDGAVLTSDRFGNENSAYSFDGVKANILAEVNNMPATQVAQSFSWWYFVDKIQTFSDEFGAGNMIVLVNSSDGIGIQVGFRGPGYNTLGLDTWKWGSGKILEVKPPDVNLWHHCVYTFDGSVHRFYIDRKEKTFSNVEPQHGNPTQLMFGNYPSGDQFFNGKLDDIRIYNRVLNQTDVNILYLINLRDKGVMP